MYEVVEKKEIKIQVRGEKTFTVSFSEKEVEQIVRNYFKANYHSNIDGMSLTVYYENDGSITVSGHQEIKEG